MVSKLVTIVTNNFYSLKLVTNKTFSYTEKRTRHLLVNAEGDCWPCTIRRSRRNNKECFLSCGWKYFCNQNKLKEGIIF